MYLWEGIAGQALGMGLGQMGETVDYQQRAYGAGYDFGSHGSFIPLSAATTTSNTLHIDDVEAEEVRLKPIEPPDEFTQLSNHKFHELLAKFEETR